ncbi:hypothetical protein FJ366_00865 [Candidatus Dependentiae bacterium]|nr:hypothetical protein [Candidatus Dependentiae bacterium]
MGNNLSHLFLSVIMFLSCASLESIFFAGYFKARRDYAHAVQINKFEETLHGKHPNKCTSLFSEEELTDWLIGNPWFMPPDKDARMPLFGPCIKRYTFKKNNLFKFSLSKLPHYSGKIARCKTYHHVFVNIPIIEKQCSMDKLKFSWPYALSMSIYLKNGYRNKFSSCNKPSIITLKQGKITFREELPDEVWIKKFYVDPVDWTPKF